MTTNTTPDPMRLPVVLDAAGQLHIIIDGADRAACGRKLAALDLAPIRSALRFGSVSSAYSFMDQFSDDHLCPECMVTSANYSEGV